MKQILPYLRPYRKKLIVTMLLAALATVCELMLPTYMSDVLDKGVRQADLPYILRCCGKMFAVVTVCLAALITERKIASDVVAGFNGDLRAAVFRKVNAMTFEEYNSLGTAALLTRSTKDIETLSWVANMATGSLITVPVLLIGGIVLSMLQDAVLGLILLASVPLVLAVVYLVGHNITPLHQTSDKYIDIQNGLMRERLHGLRVIRAFDREAQQQARIADATHIMADNIIKANVRMGAVSPIAVFLLNVAVLFVIWAGGFRMEHGIGALSGGAVFAVVQYIALTAGGVLFASMALVMLPHAQVAASRIGEVFVTCGLPELPAEEARRFSGGIRFENVSFRYENASEPAISGVSLEILPGQKVAVIGGTGSGKSTLVQMLLAFRQPTEGRISFDGVPADGLSRRVIRQNVACVLQKQAVYSGTIRSNIVMGKPDASEQELREAAEIAQLAEFVDSLPEGMAHRIEQSGKNLSGGQKQRLCIARAVLKDAPIYVFDDSFSALDFLTEAKLRSRLAERLEGRTQIVITQRVTTAMNADCIFVMDGGKLIAHGTHAALLDSCGVYREIFASQTGGARV